MQTQTSNALHNAIIEAGGKDRPPMLALERYMENYKNVSQDIRDQLNDEAESVQIILTAIDNDIYSTVDACPNARKIPQQTTRNRGKAIVNSSAPIYDQEPAMVTEDDEMSKEKNIDKLMALISPSFKKIYKPINNNLRTSSNSSRVNQDNSLRINRGTGYENKRVINVAGARENVGTQVMQKSEIQCYNCKEYGHVSRECQKLKRAKDVAYYMEKMLLCKQEEAGVQMNAKQVDWKYDTNDESDDQELEAHYMYMAQIQEVTTDTVDNSGPIFDVEPLKKELFAHQETISIMSQLKEAQIKFYKTREDKEINYVIALENKVEVLDNIVYKTGQSV
nr:hypothetical protein [Tanacetum cinerariifolium]